MTNQSELYNKINDAMFGKSLDTVDDVVGYITANYTPNSEVAEREQEAYKRGYIARGVDELTKEGE